MLYRKLGSSGIDVSAVGFGAWAIGGWMWGGADDETGHRRHSRRARCRHQPARHRSDLRLRPFRGTRRPGDSRPPRQGRHRHEMRHDLGPRGGRVLLPRRRQRHPVASSPRKKSINASARRRSATKSKKASRRLQTDHIDLYQTHWQDKTTPIADTMAELLKLKDEGKIRAIGVSNATVEHIKQYGPIDSDQEKFSMLDRNLATGGQLEFCRENNIAVLAYSPLANGLLTGKISPDRKVQPRRPPRDEHAVPQGQHRQDQRQARRTPPDCREASRRASPKSSSPGPSRSPASPASSAAPATKPKPAKTPPPAISSFPRKKSKR